MSTFDAQNEDTIAEQRLSGGLVALAELSQPPSEVSIEAVVGAGRRGVARRRQGLALGTAFVFAAAGLGAWGATQHQPGNTTATSTPVVGLGLPHTDPMTPPVGLGFLPGPSIGGYNWSVATGGYFNFADENGSVNASLTLQPVGEAKPAGSYKPAGTVNGQPAEWRTVLSDPELVWQYTPGAWADLLAEGATQAQATQIADNLRYGAQAPIAMPFHLPSLPAGFTVVGASAMRNTQTTPVAGNGSLTLCATGATCAAKDIGWNDSLNLSASTPNGFGGSPTNTLGGASTTTSTVKIHGVTAQCTQGSDGSLSVTFAINGLSVTADATGAAVKAIGGRDGLVQYLDSITWYGANPSAWTTNVIG